MTAAHVVQPLASAKIIKDSILVQPQMNGGAVYCLETSCEDHEAYLLLPAAIEFEHTLYAKTSWNSDTYRACYKRNRFFGKAIHLGS